MSDLANMITELYCCRCNSTNNKPTLLNAVPFSGTSQTSYTYCSLRTTTESLLYMTRQVNRWPIVCRGCGSGHSPRRETSFTHWHRHRRCRRRHRWRHCPSHHRCRRLVTRNVTAADRSASSTAPQRW